MPFFVILYHSAICWARSRQPHFKKSRLFADFLCAQLQYTPHSFRHSIAVHMLEAGESLIAIKAFLGHASISSTVVYAKL
ncbi:MAG: tyrosine-type recombinase/integrase, partial [Eubacteriales bacterium]|nr:tyrosine-type recombinase/integrase [Eubacteriales bacterium]